MESSSSSSAEASSISVAAESIHVLSPNGGETWHEGRTYRIRWEASGVRFVNVSAALGGHDLGYIGGRIPVAQGSVEWAIEKRRVSGFGPDAGKNSMHVLVEDADNPDVRDESDSPFSLLP